MSSLTLENSFTLFRRLDHETIHFFSFFAFYYTSPSSCTKTRQSPSDTNFSLYPAITHLLLSSTFYTEWDKGPALNRAPTQRLYKTCVQGKSNKRYTWKTTFIISWHPFLNKLFKNTISIIYTYILKCIYTHHIFIYIHIICMI